MFKIFFNKIYGIGFAFALCNIISDDMLKICKFVDIKIYVLFWVIVVGFRITPWKSPWESNQSNSK